MTFFSSRVQIISFGIFFYQSFICKMNLGLTSIVEDQRQNQSWASVLPIDVCNINDISGEAVWTLSSCKEGLGVHQLLSDREDTYWLAFNGFPNYTSCQGCSQKNFWGLS